MNFLIEGSWEEILFCEFVSFNGEIWVEFLLEKDVWTLLSVDN